MEKNKIPSAWALATLCITGLAQAQEISYESQSPENVLPATEVVAEEILEDVGVIQYGKDEIDSTIGGNGDIGSILIRHPNVQFDNARSSSDTPGDISPAKITINGAKFYDNQFIVDGVSINSNISGGVVIGAEKDRVDADSAQGLAIDTKILCKVTVLDSNVSAAYGRFVGGVVESEICKPKKKFGGDVSIEYATSKWLEKKFDGYSNEFSSDVKKQNKFTKWTLRSNFESQVNDSLGFIGSFSRKTSEIPLRAYPDGKESPNDFAIKNAEHKIENFYLKSFLTPGGGVEGDFSVMYSPSVSQQFKVSTKDSFYESASGGLLLTGGLKNNISSAQLEQKISYKKQESSRYTDRDEYLRWKYSPLDKNWALPGKNGYTSTTWSWEGNYGDIVQEEKTFAYSTVLRLDEMKFFNTKHNFSLGAEVEYSDYSFERPQDNFDYVSTLNVSSCNLQSGGVDTKYCSLAPVFGSTTGQAMGSRSGWLAGSFEHSSLYKSLFIEDAIRWDRLHARFGLRLEDHSSAVKAEIAPRLMLAYDYGEKRDVVLNIGANRYYGQNLKTYEIYQKRQKLSAKAHARKYVNGVLTDWAPVAEPVFGDNPSALKLPYTNELAFGITKKFEEFLIQAKYVHRNNKDEVAMSRDNSNGRYVWENTGSSQAKTFSLMLATNKPFLVHGTETNFSAIYDFSRKKSTNRDWSETYLNEDGLPSYVQYKGQIIPLNELPADNYHRPWTLRLISSTNFKNIGLRVDGALRIRQAYTSTQSVGTIVTSQGKISKYEDVPLKKSVNFDLKFSKYLKINKYEKIYAELSIENVFNRTNEYGFSDGYYLLEKGRQATLRVGYEF